MNLYELKEEKDDIEADIRYYEKEKERLLLKVDVNATRYDKEIVSGGRCNSREDALLELAQMTTYLDDAIKKLDNIKSLVNDKYNNYKKYNDFDKQIYTEKKMFKWNNAKISSRHNNISKSQIYNIVNKIENNNIVEKSGKQL